MNWDCSKDDNVKLFMDGKQVGVVRSIVAKQIYENTMKLNDIDPLDYAWSFDHRTQTWNVVLNKGDKDNG